MSEENEVNEESEVEVVTLVNEDGEELDFAFLALVDVDGAPFAILAPVAQLEASEPDLDLFAFHYLEQEEGVQLDAVEDEALLERVFAAAEEALFDDEDEDGDA